MGDERLEGAEALRGPGLVSGFYFECDVRRECPEQNSQKLMSCGRPVARGFNPPEPTVYKHELRQQLGGQSIAQGSPKRPAVGSTGCFPRASQQEQ